MSEIQVGDIVSSPRQTSYATTIRPEQFPVVYRVKQRSHDTVYIGTDPIYDGWGHSFYNFQVIQRKEP
jgi:regulation of enolase protein 1 (concanavalin A-like superfamily)